METYQATIDPAMDEARTEVCGALFHCLEDFDRLPAEKLTAEDFCDFADLLIETGEALKKIWQNA